MFHRPGYRVEDVEKFTRRNIHMKNLKKVLALVLVIAMVMGFAVSASATEFSDADQVAEQNATAVEVLSALNIINGFPDGTYRPTESVTRAQVAKMIAVAFNNGDESLNELYQNVACGLTDIGGSWAEGYIKYCYATGIVSGYPDGTFKPENPVTGNELCQIMLNILGYEIDTTNTPWATAVLAKSNSIGLLKNVSTAAGSAAPRQEAAQIIYNALTLPIQQSNAFGVLTDSNETILTKYLGGYTATVVVTGNEEASLNYATVADEGKTEIGSGAELETLNWTTGIDDIGYSFNIWALNGGKNNDDTVIYAAKAAANADYETFESTDSKEISEKQAGLKLTGAEKYVNYADDIQTTYTADVVITSKVTKISLAAYVDAKQTITVKDALLACGYPAAKLENATDFEVTSTKIRAGQKLTDEDLAIIQFIYTNYNTIDAEVYTGTTDKGDVSDNGTFTAFKRNYLTATETNMVNALVNENGNYVKIIDNDGDGAAEYVLKTVYTLGNVAKIAGNGTISLEVGPTAGVNALTGRYTVVTDDELATNDVVVYALIDGLAYTYKSEPITAKIDTVNRNKLTATTTDGTVYTQSGVAEEADDDLYLQSGVTNLAGSVSYDLYLDRYGYLAAFTESDANGNFVLLTNGWFNETKAGKEYAVKAYVDGALSTYDVTVGGSLFVQNTSAVTMNNAWNTMRKFSDLNGTDTNQQTIVAAMLDNGDDTYTLKPVDQVYGNRGIVMVDMGTQVPNRTSQKGTIYASNISAAYAVKGNVNDTDVRALSSTVYYYVYKINGQTVVKTYTGYAAIPNVSASDIEDVYTVAKEAKDANNNIYYTASVVVVEVKQNVNLAAEQIFLVDLPEVANNVYLENATVIRADGTLETITIDLTASNLNNYGIAGGKVCNAGLYYMWESATSGVYVIKGMTKAQIAANNYVVGTVNKDYATGSTDWDSFDAKEYNTSTQAIVAAGEVDKQNTDTSKYYTFSINGTTGTATEGDREDVLAQTVNKTASTDHLNEVLVAYNNRNQIVYAISFAELNGPAANAAQTIWSNIIPSKQSEASNTISFKLATGSATVALPAAVTVKTGDDSAEIVVAKDGYTVSATAENSAKESVDVLTLSNGNIKIENVTDDITVTLDYTAKEYTLTITNLTDATVNATPAAGSVACGTEVTISATASADTKTVVVTSDDVNIVNGKFTMPAKNVTLTVAEYTTAVTVNDLTSNTDATNHFTATNNTSATYGTDYTFTVTPAAGYTVEVTAQAGTTAVDVTDNNDGTYTIAGKDLTDTITITVTPTATKYDVTFNVTKGTASISSALVSGKLAKKYDVTDSITFVVSNADATVTVSPNTATLTATSNANEYTLSGITADTTVTIQ
jgi:hypothetical protein